MNDLFQYAKQGLLIDCCRPPIRLWDSDNLDMTSENAPLLLQDPPQVNQVIETTRTMRVAGPDPELYDPSIINLNSLQNRWIGNRLPMGVFPLPQGPGHCSMDRTRGLTHVYH